MAYSRFGTHSDVHVICTGANLECVNCNLSGIVIPGGKDFATPFPEQMIDHLRLHVQSGDKVPHSVFDALLSECAPTNYTVLFREGYDDPDEISRVREHFNVVTNRGAVAPGSIVIGRYSVLPFYKELCEDLALSGSKLINSYSQHRYLADMGNWYRDLQGITFDTWVRFEDVPSNAWPCVLKGETNSKKWQWTTHMFAKSAVAARDVEKRLQEDGLLCDQTVYFRRYVPLEKVCESVLTAGPPITREFRFFVCDGQVLTGGFYWSGFLPEDMPEPDPSEVPQSFLKEVIERVGANARFYVIDVAKTASGQWIVVELNDGQMSGLSSNKPKDLYRRLKEVVLWTTGGTGGASTGGTGGASTGGTGGASTGGTVGASTGGTGGASTGGTGGASTGGRVSKLKPQPKHITNEVGECVSWCPACGPQCRHGNNSKECQECKAERERQTKPTKQIW